MVICNCVNKGRRGNSLDANKYACVGGEAAAAVIGVSAASDSTLTALELTRCKSDGIA